VRIAIGAHPGTVVGNILIQSLQTTAIGIGFGIALTLVGARFLAPLLFQTNGVDLATFADVIPAIVACTLLAALIPALRIARLDPNAALRYE
jgi:putative ABC transport system permease protein